MKTWALSFSLEKTLLFYGNYYILGGINYEDLYGRGFLV